MTKLLLSLFFLFFAAIAGAQEQGPAMADTFRQDGKIYVVISVIALIFISILLFLVYLERKLGRLEKQIDNQTKH